MSKNQKIFLYFLFVNILFAGWQPFYSQSHLFIWVSLIAVMGIYLSHVSEGDLKKIEAKKLHMEPEETVLTIMFVDIVGFSLYAEKLAPKESFENLHKMILEIKETVKEFHGVVDRTLGDGVLCYFGLRKDMFENENHMQNAFECAKKIQRNNVFRTLTLNENQKVIFPLRIGVNTASVLLGNLGEALDSDFTVIGHGVNMAQRLENACETHRILVGQSTFLGLDLTKEDMDAVKPKWIQIKHHDEFFRAYECDPFLSQPEHAVSATNLYRQNIGIYRIDPRWQVPEKIPLKVVTDFGKGDVVDFGPAGLQVRFDRYIARGSMIQITLEMPLKGTNNRLYSLGVFPLTAEVRWGKAGAGGCVHGLKLQNLSKEKKEILVSSLRQAVSLSGPLQRVA